jgi:hypothetical protein
MLSEDSKYALKISNNNNNNDTSSDKLSVRILPLLGKNSVHHNSLSSE